jgi:glycopeptide antibiotics resistance protein
MTQKIKDQSALGYALLIYMCIVVALITLVPFEFRIPERFHITWSTNLANLVTNLLLFFPIGFLQRLSLGCNKGTDFFCLQAIALGVLLSFAFEIK